ncbi:MAG TPA: hypothetical protein VGG18_09800 [Granulicella sp.]|jgi:hypothetical protein
MQSFTLTGIAVDGRHSSGLCFSLEEARLAAALNAAGVTAKLYVGKPEGRLIDLVRQLLRARSDIYLFSITDETASTIAALAALLQANRPDAVFVFWARDAEHAPWNVDTLERLGLVVGQKTVEGALGALGYAGLLTNTDTLPEIGASASPYLQGLLRREQAGQLGMTASQPWHVLQSELSWAKQGALAMTEVIPVLAEDLTENELIQLAHSLGQEQAASTVEVQVSSTAITPDVMRALSEAGISKIRLWDDGEALVVTPADYGIEITRRGRSAQETLVRRLEYGRNGMVAMHTGLYDNSNPNAGIQHLEVSAQESRAVRKAAYEWAGTQLLLRNAVVYRGPLGLVVEEMERFISPQTTEAGGWPKHSYLVGDEGRDGQCKVYFDGDSGTEQSVQYVPLRVLAKATSEPGRMTFVSMTEKDDLDEFERQLSQFHQHGTIAVIEARQHFLYENICRWLSNGACNLPQLRRIQVTADERVLACRDSGEIGSLTDSYEAMLTLVKQRKQLESGRRGCEICPVRDECSQCVHLPQSWGGRYCEIRTTYPQTALFVRFSQFTQRLRQMAEPSGDGSVVAFAYTGLPPLNYHGAAGAQRSGERPVLTSFKDSHYCWWPKSSRIVRLSGPLACIAEAWWVGASERDIVASLSQQFAVTDEVAAENLKEGLDLLLKQKVIHD